MSRKSIIVIGAGIGGLSAGCYAQMNGYAARIYEMHGAPGGQCTAWTKGGYTFDGCIHNLAGTAESSRLHAMWEELGVFPNRKAYAYPELVQVERPDGPPLTLHTDLSHLEAHLIALSPLDDGPIDAFIQAARQAAKLDLLGLAAASARERALALASSPMLLWWGTVTMEQFARRFRDPFLRWAFPKLIYDWPGTPMILLLNMLGRTSRGDYGWIVGGSAIFAQTIAHRFHQLGGELHFRKRVRSIIVDNGRAAGVRFTDGSEERADIVISNANGYATIFDMLDGRFTNSGIRSYYSRPEDRIEMGIHVSLGVARDLSREPHAIVLPLRAPIEIAGEMRDRLYVECFGFDPTLAPHGKSPLKVVFGTSFGYWQELDRDHARYAAEKDKIAATVIAALEPRFPGIKRQVEVIDVATPMTMLRFTGIGHGYKMPPARMMSELFFGRHLSETLPGLSNFYMVGQWAGAPGVPTVAAMGRSVIRDLCRRDGRSFVATKAPADEAVHKELRRA